jgi:hypothetical protein
VWAVCFFERNKRRVVVFDDKAEAEAFLDHLENMNVAFDFWEL